MTSRASILASTRVAPLSVASFTFSTVSPDATTRDAMAARDTAVVSNSCIDLLPRPAELRRLRHYSSQLRLDLQWKSAAKIQLQVFRNSIACVVTAVCVNGCYYAGNVFSLKPSAEQSRPELLMALLVWTALIHGAKMTITHVPMLANQRFLESPNTKPSLWFCARKLMLNTRVYFIASLGGMIGVGLLVQNTSLMYKHFHYKLHFYLTILCTQAFTAGICLAERKIYYEETCQGRDRRSAMSEASERRLAANPQYRRRPRTRNPSNYGVSSFWREYAMTSPTFLLIALAGGFVHVVAWYKVLDRGTGVVMGFTMLGIVVKLGLQEAARLYILSKRIRSIRTMCILVGVPTVLIDTQSRIVLLGTQTNTILVSGTFAMVVAEICLRVGKAAYVAWKIRRRAAALEIKLSSRSGNSEGRESSQLSMKMEFELWRRQVLSYHTAEVTADMYAEYIAIACSQSIIFWFAGHPFYPALQLEAGGGLSEVDVGRWRFNQVAMLAFQFFVEIFVDYLCVVLEMAAGIDFDRIESLSTFLGMLFMTMAAININISSVVYLS